MAIKRRLALSGGAISDDCRCQAADAVEQLADGFRGGCSKNVGWRILAKALAFHLFCGGGEASGTGTLHGKKAEGLGERDAVGAHLKEFDLSADFAVDRF